jgi:hypothetical protein
MIKVLLGGLRGWVELASRRFKTHVGPCWRWVFLQSIFVRGFESGICVNPAKLSIFLLIFGCDVQLFVAQIGECAVTLYACSH